MAYSCLQMHVSHLLNELVAINLVVTSRLPDQDKDFANYSWTLHKKQLHVDWCQWREEESVLTLVLLQNFYVHGVLG